MYGQVESYEQTQQQQSSFEPPSQQMTPSVTFTSEPIATEPSPEPEIVHIKDDPDSPLPDNPIVPEFIDSTIGSADLVS